MIDEKKLISHIENQYRQWGEEYTAEQILGDIEDFPKVGEWIPVEERLPEKETDVLCYVPKVDGNVQYGIYVGRRHKVKADDGSGNFWGIPTKECDWTLKGWSYVDHPTIVAWQPLPNKPYLSENSKKLEKNSKGETE